MMDVKVCVGLWLDLMLNVEVWVVGFNEADGTFGETFDIIAKSDLVMLLIFDVV